VHLETLEKVTVAVKFRKLGAYANPKRYQIEPDKYLSKCLGLNARRDLGLATLCINNQAMSVSFCLLTSNAQKALETEGWNPQKPPAE